MNQWNLINLSNHKTNWSKEDWQALKELKNDETVIKEADKRRGVVIMSSVHYDQVIYKQLEDIKK